MEQAVIITGGAKRIGARLAQYFARNGYDIALHYHHSEAEALSLKAFLTTLGRSCTLFRYDLSSLNDIQSWMEGVKKAMPHCVGLINNASVFERAGFLETDEALFDRQMTLNLKAPFFLAQAFARSFGKGSVVNILDTNITQNNVSHFAYLLSKKALADFTVMAARTLGPQIRVGGVCPGGILPADDGDAAYIKKIESAIPLQRHPGPDEVAEAARWLIEQPGITGQLIYVDGGMHVL